mgnify:CR=1 FL=1
MTNKKHFDVKIVCPISGREVTHKHVSSDSLRQNDSGETVFRYNDYHDSCKGLTRKPCPSRKHRWRPIPRYAPHNYTPTKGLSYVLF